LLNSGGGNVQLYLQLYIANPIINF
jgi:hypothetical protein